MCAPSSGYVLESGAFTDLPILTAAEREILIDAAKALNEALPPVAKTEISHGQHERPGDEYNERGDFREVLVKHGWQLVCGGDNEYWRRPGKTLGQSATLRDRVFYVFSSNADPFEPDTPYKPFAVYALLEHSGDFKKAAASLSNEGYSRTAHRSFTPLPNDPACGQYSREPGDESESELVPPAIGEEKRVPRLTIRTAGELLRSFPSLRRMIIDGLLRIGEVMNVVAPSKFGKSWLVLSLVLAVACGLKWLGRFTTARGRVLLIDNELHPETLASRLKKVAFALELNPEDYQDHVNVICLRGELMDLRALSFELMHLEHGSYDLIVLDAWYRLQPSGSDENSNGDVTALYNLLESVSAKIGSAFACIHHTSKGNQAGKSITDVGSGAGAQSRAADSHVAMRQHEADDAVVVEAAVRSWAPQKPFVMRWDFPLWTIDELLNPADLKREKKFRPSGMNDKSDDLDVGRQKLLGAIQDNPNGASQTKLRDLTGFNGPKFCSLMESLIDSGIVEKLPREVTGARADIYKLLSGLPVQTDTEPNQTECTDT